MLITKNDDQNGRHFLLVGLAAPFAMHGLCNEILNSKNAVPKHPTTPYIPLMLCHNDAATGYASTPTLQLGYFK
ncbi:MAG: hypothetical protein EAY75_16400 [Bacteroidetes bacterium]|nr:MAG: hypothetical protein EAY75_16400 [Bacteroidota bacterium]